MIVRLVLSAVLALGLSAGAAQASACHRPARPVVHHAPRAVCHCHRVRPRHVRHHRHVRIQREAWSGGEAHHFVETGPMILPAPALIARASPLHPWDTDRNGYLTWSGKDLTYPAGPAPYAGDPGPYAGGGAWGCPSVCGPTPGPYPQASAPGPYGPPPSGYPEEAYPGVPPPVGGDCSGPCGAY